MFEFLQSIQPIVIEKEVKKVGKVKQVLNPEGLSIRIFKSGATYPSKELVELYNLEYGSENPNGLDIIDSREWSQMPKVNENGDAVVGMLLLGVSSKDLPKVDLFAYSKLEGTSVLTQGSKKLELIDKLKDIYNLTEEELFLNKNYVDIQVLTEVKVFEGLDKFYLPKKVLKGKNVGSMTYETRTNIIVNPIQIVRD